MPDNIRKLQSYGLPKGRISFKRLLVSISSVTVRKQWAMREGLAAVADKVCIHEGRVRLSILLAVKNPQPFSFYAPHCFP